MADNEKKSRLTDAEVAHMVDCFARKVSTCCEAELRTDAVIQSGRHKGHGPRYCSKCGRVAFMV